MDIEADGGVDAARRNFAAYSVLAFIAPTLIACTLTVADGYWPRSGLAWSVALFVVVLTSFQQIAWLRASDLWPHRQSRSRREGAPLLTRPTALAGGTCASAAAMAAAVGHGRAVWIWALPFAAALGILTLALTQWDREVPHWTPRALTLLIGLAAAAGATAEVVARQGNAPWWRALGVVLVACALVVVIDVGQAWWERVVTELTHARDLLVGQRLEQERLRFAGELHDLQGHDLQLIVMQSDYGRAVLDMGRADDAVSTFQEIGDTARRALQQTRAIAHGYRKVNLGQEVANARTVLDAAGIDVTITGPVDDLEGEIAHLAGLLVREATTNVLRHSATTSMTVAVTPETDGHRVEVSDPGPRRPAPESGGPGSGGPGSGLSSLGERAQRLGHLIESGRLGAGWFVRLRPREEP